MCIVSDTNVLSSLAAAEALSLLFRLFPNTALVIPPAVYHELQVGLARGKTQLEKVLAEITNNQIQVLSLSILEQPQVESFPPQLNRGECEAIILAKTRQVPLLSNDKQAIRYCESQGDNFDRFTDFTAFILETPGLFQSRGNAVTRTNEAGREFDGQVVGVGANFWVVSRDQPLY